MSTDCFVCCETFNDKSFKRTQCIYCEYAVCNNCVETYMCSSTQNAHCMNCHVGWNREMLDSLLSKKFLTGKYRKHCQDVLIDRERSLLPATQPFAEIQKRANDVQDMLVDVSKGINKAHLEIGSIRSLLNQPDIDDATREQLTRRERDVLDRIASEKIRKQAIINNIATIDVVNKAPPVLAPREFIKACPSSTCRGFLNVAWVCGLCDASVCCDCEEIKSDAAQSQHTCDKDTLQSVKFLKTDSKQCPKCPAIIFKQSGCDQMYCIKCETAFSWTTGQIETGHIHNPHYYELLRKRGEAVPRNPLDVPAGGAALQGNACQLIPLPLLLSISGRHTAGDDPASCNKLLSYHRMCLHIRALLPQYAIQDNQDLRIKFLLKEIDDAKFKTLLFQREKINEKKSEIRLIMTTFAVVIQDTLNMMYNVHSAQEIPKMTNTLDQLRAYTNESLVPISKRYGCVVPNILEIQSDATDCLEYTSTKY